MGYLDTTDAEIIALTRQRRREAFTRREIEAAHAQASKVRQRNRKRPATGFDAERCAHKFWRIFDAQGGRCFLCADPFTGDDWATVEHVKPKSLGGTRQGNVLLAHSLCNSRKGGRRPHPCEILFLIAVNDRLPQCDKQGRFHTDTPPFTPLRQRVAALAAE